MPRKRKGLHMADEVNRYIKKYPGLIYTNNRVKCTFCNVYLLIHVERDCKNHIQSAQHKENIKNKIPYWTFLIDFIIMLSVCNIPYKIVEKATFQKFWLKYVPAWRLPREKVLRTHLPRVERVVRDKIQRDIKNNKLWISVDETTDIKKNSVVNIVVRTLHPNAPSLPLLLCSKRVQATTAEAIVKVITTTCTEFGIQHNQIEMLVTDGAATMHKTGKILKRQFPHLLHVTCLLHAFHLVANTIRKSYSRVDQLVTNTKKIFGKDPKRIREFKKLCPGLPLPPEHMVTRWSTWLELLLYYKKYFQNIKSFILQLNARDAKAMTISQKLFLDAQIQTDIVEICEKYSVVRESIEQLQNHALPLTEALNIVNKLHTCLGNLTDSIGLDVAHKLTAVLNKNPDLQKIQCISQCIQNKQEYEYYMKENFKFANITLIDVERSFSHYKHVYSPRRTRLSESSIQTILMLQISPPSLQPDSSSLISTHKL